MRKRLVPLLIVLLPMLQAEWHYRHPLPPALDPATPLYAGRVPFCSLCAVGGLPTAAGSLDSSPFPPPSALWC